jgi:hypothetical protein
MATQQDELVTTSDADIFAVLKRVSMQERIVAIFGIDASETTLSTTQPVGYNSTTGFYGAWIAPDEASIEIDTDGATGGTWTMTVDGASAGDFAYNATAEDVRTTLLAMGYTVTATLATDVYTITFDADAQITTVPVLTGDVSSLTGAGGSEAATVTDGSSSYGLHTVVGFVWPDEIELSSTEQVQKVIMTAGRIDYEDIQDTVDSGDLTALATELKDNALSRGIIVENLPQIH